MSVKGLLLINLGSPKSHAPKDVKKYLREFLSDPYVIDLPTPLRYALVYGLIAPFRAKKSARAYKSIWTENGSPLVHFTRTFAEKVQVDLGEKWQVRWAMRYGEPPLSDVMAGWKVDELYIVPLYPQYAESSTRTAIEKAVRHAKNVAPKVFILQDFYGETELIESQAAQIAPLLESYSPDQLILSFHGLPEHHLTKLHDRHCLVNATCCDTVTERNRNCYRAQASFTATALRNRLAISAAKIKVTFQSRLGRRPWIKPYTDHVVSELAAQGAKRLLVSCPSFVADCLETLEEVEIRLRRQFQSEGGSELKLVPALNAEGHWVRNFCKMIQRPQLKWQEMPAPGHIAIGEKM